MEKIIIGITDGSKDRTGYNLILSAFEEPVSLELNHPIIYGDKETAIQQRKVMNLTTNFITIKSGDVTYKGVMVEMTDEAGNNTFCISAAGDNNHSIWGVRYGKTSDQ